MDIVLTYYHHKYILELKRWYGPAAHQKGIQQLSDYLDRQHQTKGYLLIFDTSKAKTWRQETLMVNNKTIFAVWV